MRYLSVVVIGLIKKEYLVANDFFGDKKYIFFVRFFDSHGPCMVKNMKCKHMKILFINIIYNVHL